jgi:hypothetical protein
MAGFGEDPSERGGFDLIWELGWMRKRMREGKERNRGDEEEEERKKL